MKELSIEEKTKRWEYIFPELKESEDERIRKSIIGFLITIASLKDGKTVSNEDFDSKELLSWASWLVNQGEHKPVETVKWSSQEESCICQLESLVKEQWREADKVHNSVNIKKMSELMFFLKTLNPSKKPQRIISAEVKEAMYDKPAEWGEEDEHNLNFITRLIERLYDKQEKVYLKESLERKINWLSSLKDKVQPQNLIITDDELAQAKKDAYNNALDKIEYYSGEPTFDDGWSAAIWYLKKRNAQPWNRWKPSDEQIQALAKNIEYVNVGNTKPILKAPIGTVRETKRINL